MKVVSTSPSFAKYSNEPIEYLQKHGLELVHLPADISEDELIKNLKDADAAIVAFSEINSRVLGQAPALKIVCKHGVGVDNIDLDAAREKNVWVTNVTNANMHAVADFSFGLMLALARQIPQADYLTKQGQWPRVFGTDVFGKSVGIIGLGAIGREVARRAKGFGMDILAYDPFPNREYAEQNHIKLVELDELFKSSDFITLHLPLTEQTNGLVGKRQFEMMKNSAFLVNASRGGIVVEEDLYQALKNGDIAGAALDVFVEEPLKKHPLFELPNFIAMPHIAGYTDGAVNALGMTCVKNIVEVLVHQNKPQFVVNGLDEVVVLSSKK
ncbi:phosphoglycerate dehydrogenase [Neobacillus drentensis]|uniref:phosphoglycerate dehydrogenase n=1 Tax=Neobacillus drentensis TaxID=220684 RepID=UPI002FFDE75E